MWKCGSTGPLDARVKSKTALQCFVRGIIGDLFVCIHTMKLWTSHFGQWSRRIWCTNKVQRTRGFFASLFPEEFDDPIKRKRYHDHMSLLRSGKRAQSWCHTLKVKILRSEFSRASWSSQRNHSHRWQNNRRKTKHIHCTRQEAEIRHPLPPPPRWRMVKNPPTGNFFFPKPHPLWFQSILFDLR